nr:PREDICTED: pickpocket protein 19-like isoform X2 [Tribolium castaneum]|eukprot:XP_015836317.1 PREDICTED: pickpocket protein 19-like isoform X2 [Tribolium castaneum]
MENKGLFHRYVHISTFSHHLEPNFRLLWSCIYIILIVYTIYMVVTLWDKFLIHPTVTTLVSSTFPVNQVPFPGVAVCSINKISKKRAQNLAFALANQTKKSPEEVMAFLHFTGQLYDFDFQPDTVSKLLLFQNILDSLNIKIDDLAREMVTPCEDLLSSCLWRNMEVNCSTIFYQRLTYDGFCCVFNYVKFTQELTYEIDQKPVTTDAGVENGLFVAVNNNLQDYFYTTISAVGVIIHIFVPTDYPDKSSGGLTEILTHPNSENFVEIVPTTLTSVRDVADYSLEKRQCLFDHERYTSFGTTYSQSDCNIECRTMSIYAMCQCIPFLIPLSNSSNVCTLADVACLNRYKEKWTSLFPDDLEPGPYLQKERQDSLRCDNKCYSSCAETVYEAHANSFPILNFSKTDNNVTRIFVYYSGRFSKLYLQDVVYYWFEVLSNFGGIFGIFVGWSLIFIIQLSAYYTRKILEKVLKTVMTLILNT